MYLFLYPFLSLFLRFHDPFRVKTKTVASHRDNSGNSRANKNKSISWAAAAAAAAALLEEKEFHGHFTTGSFFILKSYTNKIYREETGESVGSFHSDMYNKGE